MRGIRRLAVFAVFSFALSAAPPTAAHAQASLDYVALGDSYSSGNGAGSYTDSTCRRSDLAYPVLLAERLEAELTFEACFGAATEEVLAEQAPALDEETDLVTVTVGGNDIDWNEAIVACMVPAHDCLGEIERSERAARNELPGLLDALYTDIGSRAPRAEVYVLGYPRLFSATKACDALGLIDEGERRRMNQGADLLSEVIESVALEHGFTYVDVRDEFEGHAVCDDEEWIHGLTFPVGDSYHPKRSGHAEGYLPAIAAVL